MTYGSNNGFREDVYDRLDTTKEVNQRDPFIGEGKHALMVLNLEPFNHQTHGASVRCTFEVLASACHPVGSRVCKLWFLVKPSKFATQTNDGDRFADFVKKLKGSPAGHPVGQDIRTLIRDRVAEQLPRGTVIEAYGVNTSKKADKPWVEVHWTHVPQTREDIFARRQKIDATMPLPAPTQQAPQQYAPPAAQPPAQWQGYANAAPPPAQWQGYANAAPPPVMQPIGPTSAPPGGFLTGLPPQGGQNNGGNGAPPSTGSAW